MSNGVLLGIRTGNRHGGSYTPFRERTTNRPLLLMIDRSAYAETDKAMGRVSCGAFRLDHHPYSTVARSKGTAMRPHRPKAHMNEILMVSGVSELALAPSPDGPTRSRFLTARRCVSWASALSAPPSMAPGPDSARLALHARWHQSAEPSRRRCLAVGRGCMDKRQHLRGTCLQTVRK